ncbi:thiol:disulfide oxidoreductase [Acidocella aquatica]|uniref:Thiol:disulfide oxidoreductase n=1 Tax=Acidocella aquatica TaxID=1922313 RepID=A0ABQ5ZZX4_9PROT|nr:glutathione S-transferase N-terminal domain-containing protein [Acidocella aquatica]GLR65494.1 thiol:disulfide oxidoreductase [Acidocella aquatica]
MIQFHYWPSPNGQKVLIFLEETRTGYELAPVNIMQGEQFNASFLAISPNNRMPAIVDTTPLGGGGPVSVFESGAILLYLARKTGRFWPSTPAGEAEMLQWLMWQMSALGPMAGQAHHFSHSAPEKLPYAINRYITETARLYAVLNRRLAGRPYVAGADYGLADMAIYPWVVFHKMHSQNLDDFPNIARWSALLAARPAVIRAYEIAAPYLAQSVMSEDAKKHLFGQTAESTRARN